MPYCLYETCCGCVDLKTGCVIFGILNLASITLTTVSLVGERAIGGGGGDNMAPEADSIFVFIIMLILLLIVFAANVFFLLGIKKNTRDYVRWYLIVTGTLLAIGVIAFPFQEHNVIEIIARIVSMVVTIYSLLIARSYYYLKMGDDIKEPESDT